MGVLTVDLEDWFQVYNFSNTIKFDDWENQEIRVVSNTKKVLGMLDSADKKATFFVLGWVAEKFPGLIKEIYEKGHEIACHGYSHKPIFKMTYGEFAKDLDKSVSAIENACGVRPIGFRAPSFSIVKDTLWALDVLKEKGFKYDSSMVPTKHPDYGIQGIPKTPFKIRGIIEVPMTTTFGLPFGGGYFRVFPYFFSKYLMKQHKNPIFYVHPWEFDPGQPRRKLPLLKKFRHYVGLERTEKKFTRLMEEFKFGRMDDFLNIY